MKYSRLMRAVAAGSLAMTGLIGVNVATAESASAAQACETWSATLRPGATGSNVSELQTRLAGWVDYGAIMLVDGKYGDQTTKAVKRFQTAYGLSADGVAGTNTFTKLRSLTDSDCTPIHFTYAEASPNCGRGFNGTAAQKANLRRSLWQAEALRHQLGDHPMKVNSGYRDYTCNKNSGGASDSQHLTGRAIDFAASTVETNCPIARQARYAGYGGIKGYGWSGHNNHVHVDYWAANTWQAPRCF